MAAVNAQSEPVGLEKLREAVNLQAVTSLRNVSFAIAFLAGVLSIFSPCTVAVVPAFIALTFKEKRAVSKMTAVFFLGFSLSFMALGILIAYLGKVSFVYFQNDSAALIQGIGFLLVVFGALTFLGKGFTFINLKVKPGHDVPGVFAFGALFAVGWSACTGPVIAGILSIAAVLNNYAYAALLLFFYSLGIALPLFVMAFAYDRWNLAESRLVRGWEFRLHLFGQEFIIHTTKAAAGVLLILLGLLFIIFRGTTALTVADLWGRMAVFIALMLAAYIAYRLAVEKIVQNRNIRHLLFAALVVAAVLGYAYLDSRFVISTVGYAELFDRVLLQNVSLFNIIGVLVLLLFIFLAWRFIFRAGWDNGRK
ncbi:cytochrome c biogenesis protein CcdA [Candidatus Woesearchaeota archaeon]|nr:cytochrome c biogenesis protein CcdA [Candidatus Woesearchaeota archaeon]